MSEWTALIWFVVLLIGNAFFVASEFAIMSARRSQIEPLAEAGNKRAQTALRAMEEEGFIWERYLDAIVVADSLDGLFDGFNRWANPGLKWRKGGLRNH